MSLSPQELQALLEAKKTIDSSRRLAQPPVVLPVASSPQAIPFVPVALEAPLSPAGPGFGLEPRAEPSPPPIQAKAPVPPPAEKAPSELDDFASFAGQSPRRAPLPRGAKNVKCHVIERDPNSGKISQVYTYDLNEDSTNGDQIPRQPEEQPA